MDITRRESLRHTAAWIAGLTAIPRLNLSNATRAQRILFLGGTGFLGPHMVQAALSRGHTVTLLTRGRAGRELFPEVERLIGDRAGDLSALRGRSWDVVIDNSGYVPAHVRASAELLRGSVGHYVYTSTIDAYRDYFAAGITEDYPLAELPPGAPHDPNKYYGPLKALCEKEVAAVYPNAHTVIRPAWVAGPGDNNHFFTYWVMRVRRGGEMLAPGAPSDPFQLVDVRDLAALALHVAEQRVVGRFNGAAPPMTFADMFTILERVADRAVTPVWVGADFLAAQGVRPYFDLPLWWPPRNDYQPSGMPSGLGGGVGALRVSGERARALGITYRPLVETSRDLLAWYEREVRDWPAAQRPGLSPEREATLLASWKKARG